MPAATSSLIRPRRCDERQAGFARLYLMYGRIRPLPEQRSLFRPDPASVLVSLRDWSDDDLDHLLRVGALELLRRCRAVPVAVPVAQATYQAVTVPA